MAMFYQWLGIDPAEEIVKDERYEGFDAELVGQLHRSLQRISFQKSSGVMRSDYQPSIQ